MKFLNQRHAYEISKAVIGDTKETTHKQQIITITSFLTCDEFYDNRNGVIQKSFMDRFLDGQFAGIFHFRRNAVVNCRV